MRMLRVLPDEYDGTSISEKYFFCTCDFLLMNSLWFARAPRIICLGLCNFNIYILAPYYKIGLIKQ